MNKYLKEYKWSNIGAMLKNNKKMPKICTEDFSGKLVVISGTTSGIGYFTAKLFASHNANIICINRNKEKTENFCKSIKNQFGVSCNYYIADYSNMEDIKRVGKQLAELDKNIDVIIHNAGVFQTKKTFTNDGIEKVFQVNFLSSFIINYLIKEKLKVQKNARILYVNSEGHRFAIPGLKLNDLNWKKQHYTGLKSYGVAKTAQLLSLIPFCKYFENSTVTINAMHPGDVKTNMGENNGKIYKFFKHHFINPSSKSPEISAEALYYLAVSKDLEKTTGQFFNLTTKEIPAPHALDYEMAWKLWGKAVEIGQLNDKK